MYRHICTCNVKTSKQEKLTWGIQYQSQRNLNQCNRLACVHKPSDCCSQSSRPSTHCGVAATRCYYSLLTIHLQVIEKLHLIRLQPLSFDTSSSQIWMASKIQLVVPLYLGWVISLRFLTCVSSLPFAPLCQRSIRVSTPPQVVIHVIPTQLSLPFQYH